MNKKDLKGNIMFVFFMTLFIVIAVGVNYLDQEFNLRKAFVVFNWIVIFFLPIYYFFFYTMEKIVLKKMEKKNITQKIDIDYYRDIIKKYSPAVLSIIYDGRMELYKDLALNILYLENKGYISIEDDKIVQVKELTEASKDLQMIMSRLDLVLKEQYSYNDYGQTKHTEVGKFYKEWPNSVFATAIDNNLVIERKEKKRPNLLSIVLFIEGVAMVMLDEPLTATVAFVLAFTVSIVKYLTFVYNQYPKTQAGYEIYVKLKGLENFIKDFSKLNERQLKELELWDDYMLYTIMFSRNKKLNKEFNTYFNTLRNKNNNMHTIKNEV